MDRARPKEQRDGVGGQPPAETEPATGNHPAGRDATDRSHARRVVRSTLFFSVATGLSRVLGLVREVIAASLYGVSGAMSAFTIAFQVPNLVRALFADSALQGAFVPVFTELLERCERRRAFRVASTLAALIVVVLGLLTVLFVVFARSVMALFAPGFANDPALADLTVTLARLLFPIVLLLALTGLVVGILNAFDHFAVPALAPVAWNAVIIAALVALTPALPADDRIYAYAIGILAGTIVQLLLPLPWLRGRGGRLGFAFAFRDPYVWRVLKLMLPVTVALGLINLSLLIDSLFGTLVSDAVPAAIDKAFRIYQLPQGLFSISIATILFPTLSRLAARGDRERLRAWLGEGVRQVLLLLIPSAVLMAVLAEPITRLVYQRGSFDAEATELVSTAMVWWSLSLPAQGVSLLFSRTFFSLQRPWLTTALSLANLAVNAAVAAALHRPFGIAGIVLGTVAGTIVMCLWQGAVLRRELAGIEGWRTAAAATRMVASATVLALCSWLVWSELDALLGRAVWAQAVAVVAACGAGGIVYLALCRLLGVREIDRVWALLRRTG